MTVNLFNKPSRMFIKQKNWAPDDLDSGLSLPLLGANISIFDRSEWKSTKPHGLKFQT